MSELPKVAFARLKSPPPDGTIQFCNGYVPQLAADTYSISFSQKVYDQNQNLIKTYPANPVPQQFTVTAPEFTIDSNIIQNVYPPNNSIGQYDTQIPYIVLRDPALPWERSLIPGSNLFTEKRDAIRDPLSWTALVIFAEGEIYLPPEANTPLATCTVGDFLKGSATVLPPNFPENWVPETLQSSQCQTIKIPGAIFNAVMPSQTDMRYLAHCQIVQSADEGDGQGVILSVLLANRLAFSAKTATALRYYAHLVSLEGFADYLGANPQPIPKKPGSNDLLDIQLVSLADWSFISTPQTGQSFKQLMSNLIDSGQTLSLPPPGQSAPAEVSNRIADGYVPLRFVTGTGVESFAWYRGPFSPVSPQSLPSVDSGFDSVSSAFVPVQEATTAESLMIYLAEQGLFDLSYSAAWNIGRNLALADANFAQKVNQYRLAANAAITTLAQRMAMPHLGGEPDVRKLLGRMASRQQFSKRMAEGLGLQMTEALAQARLDVPPRSKTTGTRRALRKRHQFLAPQHLLAQPQVVAALAEHLTEKLDPVAAWLADLMNLKLVPFSYLIPNPALLPPESVRFFYIDSGWTDALQAGAMSIAFHHSADVALLRNMLPTLRHTIATHSQKKLYRTYKQANTSTAQDLSPQIGLLIRSQLVPDCPALAISASQGGTPVSIVRDECLSPTVRLCLFAGSPDTIHFAEPYQGLQFGMERGSTAAVDSTLEIALRSITGKNIGAATGQYFSVATDASSPYFRPGTPIAGGILSVETLATALNNALGTATNFGGGNFALQMVKTPEIQSFTAETFHE